MKLNYTVFKNKIIKRKKHYKNKIFKDTFTLHYSNQQTH